MKYRVWDEDTYGESEDGSEEFEFKGLEAIWGAERAAEEWIKKQDHTDGYPDGMEILVREVETERLYKVTITTDFSPTFYCDGKHVEHIDGKLRDA